MLIQVNSGRGPKECEYACYMYICELLNEFPDLVVLERNDSAINCTKSAVLYSEKEIEGLEGSVQWICQSPFRLHHKRKNWFIDVSVLKETSELVDEKNIRYEIMHSSGKGGQNVNKVATAVRAIHIPAGISVVCMDQRTQSQNKKLAYEKLILKLKQMNDAENNQIAYNNWNQHNQIVRGNPYRVYIGIFFKRIR